MRKLITAVAILLVIVLLAGCSKVASQAEFMEFAEECRAQKYYKICNELVADANRSYFYNHDKDIIIFESYTMLEKCRLDNDSFENVKSEINEKLNISEITTGYVIDGVAYDIYYVDDEDRFYGEYQEFGFIAFNEEKDFIDFYWFYDQDYDPVIDNGETFDEFFKDNFAWLEKVV